MGFFDNVKKGAKSYLDDYKKTSADNKKYRRGVNEAVKVARREAFKKEAIKQAKLKAQIVAKQKFNPSPSQQSSGGMTAEARAIIYGSGGFGQPTPSTQRVVQQIQKTRSSPKKKKKKSRAKTRVVYRTVQAPKPVDRVAEMLRNLPQ